MVVGEHLDPNRYYLNSPLHFAVVSLAEKDSNTDVKLADGRPAVCGTVACSVNRLKGKDDRFGAFFIFHDLSIKIQGTYRLKYTLLEFSKEVKAVRSLCIAYSTPFKVSTPRDFGGLAETTFLCRSFADQGVRIRVRKNNARTTRKRGRVEGDDADSPDGHNSSNSSPHISFNQQTGVSGTLHQAVQHYEQPTYTTQGPSSIMQVADADLNPPDAKRICYTESYPTEAELYPEVPGYPPFPGYNC